METRDFGVGWRNLGVDTQGSGMFNELVLKTASTQVRAASCSRRARKSVYSSHDCEVGALGARRPKLCFMSDDLRAKSNPAATEIPQGLRQHIETLWDYHNMHHELRRSDVGIGLGSHDLGVAIIATDLYQQGYFPHIVFTGANAPTTAKRFPRGEAVHYRDYALEHGVPSEAIYLEPEATNTAENFIKSRNLLEANGIFASSILVMSRPYQQRRAYATCRMLWPEVEVTCASNPLSLDDYLESIGDSDKVVNMLVGDTQRIEIYANRGFAIAQEVPDHVKIAFSKLLSAGYNSRLVEPVSDFWR